MSFHILHMTSGHEAFDTRILAKQCAGVASQGHRVTLVARTPQDELTLPDGVQLVTVPRPKGRYDRFFNTARNVVAAARAQAPDIYHFHDPDLLPHMIRLARQGARVVYDVHEDYRASAYDRDWMPNLMRGLVSKSVGHMETRIGQLGWISAATPDIAAYFDAERTALIQNFPSLAEFDIGHAPTPLASRDMAMVYVGAITAERGVSEIIDAMPEIAQQHPNVRFDLVGPAAPEYLSDLKNRPGWAWTRFHGRQDRFGVVQLLHQAKMGLVTLRDIPRYRAAQPTKLYEYMAAGLPVVSSDFPRWRSQIGENPGLFVDPKTPAIVKAVLEILNNPTHAAKMGQAGRAIVEEKFSWEADLRRLMALYDKAMAS